jgi:hypothetical protein
MNDEMWFSDITIENYLEACPLDEKDNHAPRGSFGSTKMDDCPPVWFVNFTQISGFDKFLAIVLW